MHVFALIIQHGKHIHRIAFFSMASLPLSYFFSCVYYLIKETIVREK